jgi:hypothetical protein
VSLLLQVQHDVLEAGTVIRQLLVQTLENAKAYQNFGGTETSSSFGEQFTGRVELSEG